MQDKNTTIAFVLIGLILVTWLYFNAPEQQPVETPAIADSTIVTENQTQRTDPEESIPSPLVKSVVEVEDTSAILQDFASTNLEEKIITIENDLVVLELTTKGARIHKYFLKEYNTWYYKDKDEDDFYSRQVQLINYRKNGGDFNLYFVTKEGRLVNTQSLDFSSTHLNDRYVLTGDDSLQVTFEYRTSKDNVIKKVFTFYGDDYASNVDIVLENMDDVISDYRYDLTWANGINFVEYNSVDEANYSNAIIFTGGEKYEIDASDPAEIQKKDLNGKIDWMAVRNKYFTVLIAPLNATSEDGAYVEGYKKQIPGLGDREYYSTTLKVPFKNQKVQTNSFQMYIGPLEYSRLKSYGREYQEAFDFGSFFGLKFITKPISEFVLLPLFTFLHGFIPNYGFVIIVFSLIIKLALYPLTKQSYKSMKKMSLLQPKIAEIKEKYKDDQQRIQKETMKLYQTYGINPAGGCLPMVLQMPILFALFTFFNVAIEIRNEPFIFWITNLAAPDVIYELPFTLPLFGLSQITVLAPVLGITMFFQQKMTMKDPSQKAMVYMMPVMFTLMFMNFPSGLNLYYLMFNLLSIIQQNLINRNKGESELVPVPKSAKKKGGGFMSRMMEAAEKQAQAQKQGQKKKR